MLPGAKYSAHDILRIVRRRKWLIALPLVAGVVAGTVSAKRVPRLYRSETLIMVVPQRIPTTYVTPTDTTRIQDRLTSLNEQIRSRSRLERMIIDLNLYEKERARGIMEDVVRRMDKDIVVEVDKKGDSFRVTYVNTDPKLAQQVTERLASWYIEENLRERESFADSTNQFLEAELEDAKRRLLEQEKKLEAYRRQYSGQLPTQLEPNLRAMQNAQLQLQAASDSINRARERRLLIERQLADARSTPIAVAAPAGDDADTEGEVPLTAAQQLERAQVALERFKQRFTANHPDVRALERNVRELQAKAAEEGKRPSEPAAIPASPAEMARSQRIRDFEAELGVIDRQIATHQSEQVRLNKALADLQAKVDAVPSRESELVELTRDYGTLQTAYTSLLSKREESKLAANLERRQIGVQFKVLDPASLPVRPSNLTTHLAIFGGATFAGLALGVLWIGFLEYRDSSFKTEADVARVLSLPVLALVPRMVTEHQQQALARKRRLADVGAAAVVVIGMTAAVVIWRLQS